MENGSSINCVHGVRKIDIRFECKNNSGATACDIDSRDEKKAVHVYAYNCVPSAVASDSVLTYITSSSIA